MKRILTFIFTYCLLFVFSSSFSQNCCPEITKSSVKAGNCTITNGGSCNVCKDVDATLSIENGKNFPGGGQVSWYYSSTPGFNPSVGQGTLIGSVPIPIPTCDNAGGVKFNEIMVKPTSNDDDMSSPTTGEWIELIGPPGTDLGCYIISDGDWAITIPPGYSIQSDGLFVIGFTATAGSAVDLNVAGCGCTTGNVNKVLTLDNGGEWLAMFDGNNTIDAFRWGNPTLFNTFPFGDLIAGGTIPGAMLIGCVQNYTPGFPTFETNSNTTAAGETYSRKPDFSGAMQVSCATIGSCNTGGNIYPLELKTTFSGSICNQNIYVRGLVTPKPSGCNSLMTPQYSLFVSCPVKDLNQKLCSYENIIVNGNSYDINNPSGQEVLVGGSYLGCDSIVNINLTFNPEVSASISGDYDICLGQSVNIPVSFTGTAPFTFTYQINGNTDNTITTSNNPYNLKLTPNSSITVTLEEVFDKNNCTGKVSGVVNINVDAPKASLSSLNLKACAGDTLLIPVTLTGIPDFTFTYLLNGKPQTEIVTDKNPYLLKVIASESILLSLKEMKDDQGCQAKISGQDTIIVSPKLKINNLIETCYPGNTYDVSFVLSGGDPKTWTVIGPGNLTDSMFVSSSLTGGTSYQFIIKDSTGCTTDTITNNVKCNCFNNVGIMDKNIIHSCINASVTATYDNQGQILGSNDILKFILHDNGGNSPGTIWAESTTPQFSFIPGMIPEVTYYISAVIGKQTTPGMIDFSDECLQTAPGTPVIFHDFPTINTPADDQICVGSCIDINSTLFGNGPIDVTFILTSNLGSQTQNVNVTSNNLVYNYCAPLNNGAGTTTFTVTELKDKYCTAVLSDEVKIKVSTPTVNNLTKDLCIGQSITVNGTVYSESNPAGVEILSGGNSSGCDSTINVNLNFVQTVVENKNLTICPGSSITINGTVFNAGNTIGSFNFPGGSAAGCDSVLNVNVGFYTVNTGQLVKTLCNGESITVNGKIYDVNNPTGIENLAGQAWNGCDSLVQIQLTVLPAIFTLYKDTLCKGQTVVVNGTIYDFSKPAGLEVFKNGSYTGCDSTVQVQLLYNDDVTATISGPASLCPGESLMLTFNFSQPGSYNVVYNDGKGQNLNLNNISNGFMVDLGLYSASAAISLISVIPVGNNCNVTLGPPINVAIGQLAASIQPGSDYNGYEVSCPGAADGILSASTASGTAPFTFIWSNGQNTNTINKLIAGTYTVTISDSKGCTTSLSFDMNEPPSIVLNAAASDAGCSGNAGGTITVTKLSGGAGSLLYSLNGGNLSPASAGQIIDNLVAGTYIINIQDENGCKVSSTLTINQSNASNLVVDAGPDIELEANKQWGLTITTNFVPASISWFPANGLNCSNCLNPVVKLDTTTTYVITLTDNKGCIASDSLTINILDPDIIFIPNVFSPDGDGINDRLVIFASDQVKAIKKFEVFDRWGEKVYSGINIPVNDLTYGWDGKLRNQKANLGVYVYYVLVELSNGKERLFKGDVTLFR